MTPAAKPYALYLTHRGDPSRCNVFLFAEARRGRAFLDALADGETWLWEDADPTPTGVSGSTVVTESGVVASTRDRPDLMREMVECGPGGLDARHADAARRFRLGPVADDDRPDAEPRRQRPTPQPRASRDGLVPIADIAAELGVEPREARAALRGLKVERPAAGWAFPAAEVAAVRERIRAAL